MTSDSDLGKVLVLGPFLDPIGSEVLGSRMTIVSGEGHDRHEIESMIADVDAVYVTTEVLNADAIAAGKKLKVIGTVGSGTNRIDVAAATAAGIPVTNATGAGYKSVSEHAIGLMLSLSKKIGRCDRWMHTEQRFPTRDELQPLGPFEELEGKTVGVIGLGFIGKDIAEKCRLAFGMRVLGFDPFAQRYELERQHIEPRRDLVNMIEECDFVVVAAPLNDATRGLVGQPELAAMKKSAYLIAVSRGGVVDEQALIRALQAGDIAGAGVDVFDPEPAAPNNPLFQLDNAIVTAHIAGGTREAFFKITEAVTRQMIEILQGHGADNLVNPTVWEAYCEKWIPRQHA